MSTIKYRRMNQTLILVAVIGIGSLIQAVAAASTDMPGKGLNPEFRELQVLRRTADAKLHKDDKAPAQSPLSMRALVLFKLQQQFDAADRDGLGLVTREQLALSGWILMARHFDDIDRRALGQIRFADIVDYLRARGAQL